MAARKGREPRITDTGNRASRGEFVRAEVRKAIERGRFPPGERIRETDIAGWLGVSRTPVREALSLLQAEGLLSLSPTRGMIVAELDRQQVVELYKVRAALEGLAAGLAARHISDTELELLGDVLQRCEAARDMAQVASLNRRFHEGIYAGSHNRYLIQQLNTLSSAMALLRGTTYSVPGRPEAAHAEHLALFEALKTRDPEAAEAAARRHLRGAELARLKMMMEEYA